MILLVFYRETLFDLFSWTNENYKQTIFVDLTLSIKKMLVSAPQHAWLETDLTHIIAMLLEK